MDRRALFRTIAGVLVAGPLATSAQTKRLWRIGYLTPTRRAESETLLAQISEALNALGDVDGRSVTFELRTAEDSSDRLAVLATELVRARVDLIIAVSPPAILAARRATSTIPIVMGFWGGEGLIESGIVESFARPGGNVTGVYMLANELEAKRLDLLLQALPNAQRVAILNPGDFSVPDVRQVTEKGRVELRLTATPTAQGYAPIFETMVKEHIDAVLVPSFPRFFLEHKQIIELAAKHRIPAIYEWGDMARDGGLMAYGPVLADLQRRVALYVHRILRGAKPSDMAVEQPTNFELVINLQTARSLGVTLPPSLLLRANEVIR